MDHRRVQRTLFRMQLDPEFARRVRAGESEAVVGLGAGELRLLRDADPVAVSADRGGRRHAQFLANVSGEFSLSIAAGLDPEGFAASAELHDAIERDFSLPLAFSRYAQRCTKAAPSPLRALVALETALAQARRELREMPALRPGVVALAPWAWLEDVPGGTLALAAALRAALDVGTGLPAPLVPPEPDEVLLVRASVAAAPFRLRDVEVERLSPALAALLRAAHQPATRDDLAELVSTPRVELDPVIDALLADRILVAG